jgi:hypothetical protein
VIVARQKEMDADDERADDVREAFEDDLRWGGFKPESDVVLYSIPETRRVLESVLGKEAVGVSPRSLLTSLGIDELKEAKSGSMRGWKWTGKKATASEATKRSAGKQGR